MFVFEYIDLFLLKKIYFLENDKGNFSLPLSSVYNRTFNEVGFQIRFFRRNFFPGHKLRPISTASRAPVILCCGGLL